MGLEKLLNNTYSPNYSATGSFTSPKRLISNLRGRKMFNAFLADGDRVRRINLIAGVLLISSKPSRGTLSPPNAPRETGAGSG